ncbi:hypothetical protein OKW43_004315 [Paraburkholderia sp. WC7.3g]
MTVESRDIARLDEGGVTSSCEQHAEFLERLPDRGDGLNCLNIVLRDAPWYAFGDLCIGRIDRSAWKDEGAWREARLRRTPCHQHFNGGRSFVVRVAQQQHRCCGAGRNRLSLRVEQLCGAYYVTPSD